MGSGPAQNDGTFLNLYGWCLRHVKGPEPACWLSPIKGRYGHGQALCVFFLDRVEGWSKTAGGTEELAEHKGLGEGGSGQGDTLTTAWEAGPGQGLQWQVELEEM